MVFWVAVCCEIRWLNLLKLYIERESKFWPKDLGHLFSFKHNDILSYSKEDLSSLENVQSKSKLIIITDYNCDIKSIDQVEESQGEEQVKPGRLHNTNKF